MCPLACMVCQVQLASQEAPPDLHPEGKDSMTRESPCSSGAADCSAQPAPAGGERCAPYACIVRSSMCLCLLLEIFVARRCRISYQIYVVYFLQLVLNALYI